MKKNEKMPKKMKNTLRLRNKGNHNLGPGYGENNPQWKGDEVGHSALHEWVSRRFSKPKLCENCHEEPPYDLHNRTGTYKRNLEDWTWVCRSCHMKLDGRLEKQKKLLSEREHSKEEIEKLLKNYKKWLETEDGKKFRKESSNRMKKQWKKRKKKKNALETLSDNIEIALLGDFR